MEKTDALVEFVVDVTSLVAVLGFCAVLLAYLGAL